MINKKLGNATNSTEVHTSEWSEVESAFPRIFGRQGRIKDHVFKHEFKENENFNQQTGRRAPIQLQEAVQMKLRD